MQSKPKVARLFDPASPDVPPDVRQDLGWTEARVEHLVRLWREGWSASQIASVLGGVTRNAVIGKLLRLGQTGRAPSPPGRRGHCEPKRRQNKPLKPAPPRVVAPPPQSDTSASRAQPQAPAREAGFTPSPAPGGVRAGNQFPVEMRNGCRWIEGDPRRGGVMCGQPQAPGSAYCAEHHARCYQPVRPAPKVGRDRVESRNNRPYAADVRVARALIHIGGGML